MGVVYVLEHEAYLSLDGGTLKVARRRGREVLLQKPMIHVEEIVLLGNAVVTPGLLKYCAREGIGVHYLSQSGGYYARLASTAPTNVPARVAQFAAHLDPARKLELARAFVRGKLRNNLVFLRRNGAGGVEAVQEALGRLERVREVVHLRGLEGAAADAYFRGVASLLP